VRNSSRRTARLAWLEPRTTPQAGQVHVSARAPFWSAHTRRYREVRIGSQLAAEVVGVGQANVAAAGLDRVASTSVSEPRMVGLLAIQRLSIALVAACPSLAIRSATNETL